MNSKEDGPPENDLHNIELVSSITEEDIDQILKHGELKKYELDQELRKLEQRYNLQNFSIHTDEHSMYVFEGENYKKFKDENFLDSSVQFIDVGSRERKAQSYDINKYYRDVEINIS